ncbi:helix-turn-helix domain-containing protein [Wielerella bovis]|uniref:helix-turn-helix domain-containing protein n=1 Tax=Wielerella bovis TaxID=2917790 RepID=UPI00201959E8|nr:helix-turn-helix domain-containing protein [Wielerella bovis]ULJ63245.1 helix-turn-helix domain-containing protein [Wielerella bovis]
MHPELIRAEIRMRGKTLTDVAKQYEISPRVVSLALKEPSLSGEKAIAAFLNKPLHELFPERWTRDGQRIRPRYRYLYEEVAA